MTWMIRFGMEKYVRVHFEGEDCFGRVLFVLEVEFGVAKPEDVTENIREKNSRNTFVRIRFGESFNELAHIVCLNII